MTRRRARRGVGVAAVALSVLAPGACSSSPPTTVSASDATDRIVQEWHFSDDARPCLRSALADDDAARRALDADHAPSDGDLEALAAAVNGCVDGPDFAVAIAPVMVAGYAGVGATIDTAQEQCVQTQLAGLSEHDRGLLLTGPLSQMRDPTSARSTAVADVLHRVLEACGIAVGSPSTTDTTPS